MALTSSMRSLAEMGYASERMEKGMDLVSSARISMRRMTSDVLVPSFSNSLAVRSFKSAGTRT